MNNPKMDGSGLIDCVPQTGQCPHKCDSCFYNLGFYRTLDEPLIPSAADAALSIVRVNSGHDSAIQKDLVLERTAQFPAKFYNTSTTDLDFPAPVVMTVNPGDMTDSDFHAIDDPPTNLMFVRARTNLWNISLVKDIVHYYATQRNVPVVLTFMRYYDPVSIPVYFRDMYKYHKHILRSYFSIDRDIEWQVYLDLLGKQKVYLCGSYFSSSCKSCGNCLREYHATMYRLRKYATT
jgi:hypothetical protein